MDSTLRGALRVAVLDWAATRGATTLLVTHDAVEATLAGSIQLRVDGGVVRITN
ncbi:MAG: hypothetical protein U5K74_01225 [Gemmatimonadaceae bacterium]|nr:hypothetical protein [Gemmatimonadaceae bacterium]